jgi:hypothetical protein
MEGMTETLRAFQGLEADLRKEANSELRSAARECAARLAVELVSAASASGVPVAPRVARSIRVKSDRLPVVTIGGPMKVGTGKQGSAGALVWGSEQGPKGDPNRFGVAPNLAGYWIAPATKRFEEGPALDTFRRAVAAIMRRWGLL